MSARDKCAGCLFWLGCACLLVYLVASLSGVALRMGVLLVAIAVSMAAFLGVLKGVFLLNRIMFRVYSQRINGGIRASEQVYEAGPGVFEENACISYFYWQGAWREDLWAVIVGCFQENCDEARSLKRRWIGQKEYLRNRNYSESMFWRIINKLVDDENPGPFSWFFGIISLFGRGFFAFFAGFRYIISMCFTWVAVVWWFAFLPIVAAVVCICVAVSSLFAFELYVIERCYLFFAKMEVICPSCHRSPLHHVPEYKCPGCGARQHSLLPTARYGVFYRVCSGCGAHLPTSRFFGRHTLEAFCPHRECRASFDKGIESCILHNVVFVGSQYVGKSSLLTALVADLTQSRLAAAGWDISYPSSSDKNKMERLCSDFVRGERQASTRGDVRAFSMDLRKRRGAVHRLSFFDPPGEVFCNSGTVAGQNYFRHMQVSIFVIDPFSIPEVMSLKKSYFDHESISAPDNSPDDGFARWHIALEQHMAVNTHRVPCAIVINKTDSPGLQQHTRIRPGASSETCEGFLLRYGLGNMVYELRTAFEEVRFFAIAAHPRVDIGVGIESGRIQPMGVIPIAEWIMGKLHLSNT